MEISKPGPAKDYESLQEFNSELDRYRTELAEALGVSLDQLHAMGPEAVKKRLEAFGHVIADDAASRQ